MYQVFQHGGGNRKHETIRDRAAQKQDIVEEKTVDAAIAIFERKQELLTARIRLV
jgi:hypothetical protein